MKNSKCFSQKPLKRKYWYSFECKETWAYNLKVNYKAATIKDHIAKDLKANPNTDILPKTVNSVIRDCVEDLGIKIKPIRSKYPSLCAYLENRCSASRHGILTFLNLFEDKLKHKPDNVKSIEVNRTKYIDYPVKTY